MTGDNRLCDPGIQPDTQDGMMESGDLIVQAGARPVPRGLLHSHRPRKLSFG
jgi:hypothetical protein